MLALVIIGRIALCLAIVAVIVGVALVGLGVI